MINSKTLGLGLGIVGFAVASTASAAPVTKNFNGLAFNGSGGGSWSVIHPSSGPMDGTGTILKELATPDLNVRDLNYSVTWDDANGDYTDAGALDGATISFEQTDFLFDRKNKVGDFIMRLQASTLNINSTSNIGGTGGTPLGYAKPNYGLTGVLDFQILDLNSNVLFDSSFNLPSVRDGDLNSGPFNGLAVGDQAAQGPGSIPTGDIAMFIWAASVDPVDSNVWTDYNSNWDDFLGVDLGMWGTGVAVPAPAGMALLGFGLVGLIATRRKSA